MAGTDSEYPFQGGFCFIEVSIKRETTVSLTSIFNRSIVYPVGLSRRGGN